MLTVGTYTYTSDQRFATVKENDEWTLSIKWVTKRDSGIYECQVSTLPVRSFFVALNVVGKKIKRLLKQTSFQVLYKSSYS